MARPAVELAAVMNEMRSISGMKRRQGTTGVALGGGRRARGWGRPGWVGRSGKPGGGEAGLRDHLLSTQIVFVYCHTATMVKQVHPFTKLSPEEREKQIAPGDVWPVSSISFDKEKGEMVMTIRHHASATDMLKVPGSRELLGSAALWWASLTEKLYPLDAKDLAEQSKAFSWTPFSQQVEGLIEYLLQGTPAEQANR